VEGYVHSSWWMVQLEHGGPDSSHYMAQSQWKDLSESHTCSTSEGPKIGNLY
jgi:hypothetical protein